MGSGLIILAGLSRSGSEPSVDKRIRLGCLGPRRLGEEGECGGPPELCWVFWVFEREVCSKSTEGVSRAWKVARADDSSPS